MEDKKSLEIYKTEFEMSLLQYKTFQAALNMIISIIFGWGQ